MEFLLFFYLKEMGGCDCKYDEGKGDLLLPISILVFSFLLIKANERAFQYARLCWRFSCVIDVISGQILTKLISIESNQI